MLQEKEHDLERCYREQNKITGVTFDMLENEKVTPVVHKRTSGHIMFDVKINFVWKARGR